MDNKKALEIVNSMIEEHNKAGLKSIVNDFLSEIKKQHTAPLRKAIEDVQADLKKIDPTTKLPGTMMIKQMGDMQSNLNPEKGADMSNGIVKADPATTPSIMHASEGKKHDWKDFVGKCMKTLTASESKHRKPAQGDKKSVPEVDFNTFRNSRIQSPHGQSVQEHLGIAKDPENKNNETEAKTKKTESLTKPYVSNAQRGKFHAMEERGEINPKVVKEFDQASKGKKLPEHIAKALGGIGSPSTPTSSPDRGFGAVIVKTTEQSMKKDDKPHPAGSPEERSHAVSEGLVSLPKAFKEVNRKGNAAVDRFFNHLRSLKKPGTARSPENNLSPEVKKTQEKPENMKDMSQATKETIKESADKPFEVQPERPGQANKPT